MWNGDYYEQVWKDGTRHPHVLQDQMVGILFGVVPPERAGCIIGALAANRCPLGVCEMFPIHPELFGYPPGSYHNGGIWPWLSFAGAWARLVAGRRDEALSIIRDTARADLSARGDWLPHEYVQSETGANEGKPIQAWNAALFGLLHFGLRDKPVVP